MSRFCTQCGAENKEDAKFCRQCGAQLARRERPQPERVADPGTPQPSGPVADLLAGQAVATTPFPSAQTSVARGASGSDAAAGTSQTQALGGAAVAPAHPVQDTPNAATQAGDPPHPAAPTGPQLPPDTAAAPQETERAQREQALRAAAAPRDAQIQPRARAAESPPSSQPPRPAALPAAQPKSKGINAALVGGIAVAVIALLLIGGGGLWWARQRVPQAQPGAAAAPGSMASAAAASANAAPARPASPAAVASAAQPAPQPTASPAPPAPQQTPSAPRSEPAAAQPQRGEPRQHVTPHPAAKSQPETFKPVTPRVEQVKPKPAPAPQPLGVAPPSQATPRPEQAAPEAAPAPAQTPTSAPQSAPVAAAQPLGRVQALRAGLEACERKGNFFTKQLCIQETRWKYCGAPLSPDPLWGKVPECPNSAQQHNSP